MLRVMGAVIAVVVLAAACGGSEGVGSAAPVATVDAEPSIRTSRSAVSSAFDHRVSVLADAAITNLGSDEDATQAVLLAMDAGYDFEQIAAAITADSLDVDGTVAGVAPAGPPVGLILAFFQRTRGEQPQPTQIEVLRQAAAESADRTGESATSVIGYSGTHLVIGLLAAGFTPSQIVEALLFGVRLEAPDDEDALISRCRQRSFAGQVGATSCTEVIDDQCRYTARIGGEIVVPPRCVDLYADDPNESTGSIESTEDPEPLEPSAPALSVTSYSLVSTGSPTGGGELILDGSLDIEVEGDALRFTGQLTWDDPLVGTVDDLRCWATDTFAFAGEAPFTGELLVPLAFTESLDATVNGDCGAVSYDFRIADHLDNEANLYLQATISDGVLVGGDYDGAVVLEPTG